MMGHCYELTLQQGAHSGRNIVWQHGKLKQTDKYLTQGKAPSKDDHDQWNKRFTQGEKARKF